MEEEVNQEKLFIEVNCEKLFGNYDKVIIMFWELFWQDGERVVVVYELGRLLYVEGQLEEVIKYLKIVIEKEFFNEWYFKFLVDVY